MENNAKPITGIKAHFIMHLAAMKHALALIFAVITFPLYLLLKCVLIVLIYLKKR
jgi:hypothetical protein